MESGGRPIAHVARDLGVHKEALCLWRILQPVEVARVTKAFTDDRGRRVFLTFVLTALRRSELVALQWQHVNLVEATLRVTESKRRRANG